MIRVRRCGQQGGGGGLKVCLVRAGADKAWAGRDRRVRRKSSSIVLIGHVFTMGLGMHFVVLGLCNLIHNFDKLRTDTGF